MQRAVRHDATDSLARSIKLAKRKLPIGIQTFREVRQENCYYVDKTAYLWRLLKEGKHYFLSRPRRFGKSLFLDVCKELLEGNKPLFEGLFIHDRWDWSVAHPVLRLSFASGHFQAPGDLRAEIADRLTDMEAQAGIAARHVGAAARLRHLIETLHRRTGQRAALLIDEYDKPILDALETPEVACANRDFLRGLYAVVKDSDAHIRFSFITGVSKFSKVSLFSAVNNLTDITMEPAYSAICGYTDADVDRVFAPELAGFDRLRIRDWYNGYGWLGEDRVYNPYDILLLFRTGEFAAHWFETATPAFLVDRLFERRISTIALEDMVGSAELLSTFDVDDMPSEALLFQAGYLTIIRAEPRGGEMFYRLAYPNREVRQSLNRSLLNRMTGDASGRAARSARLYDLLLANDFEGLRELFQAFFASIPHQWYTNNRIARYEGFYASVFYSYFAGLGLDVTVEDSTSHARLDMALRFNDRIYLFEFKVVESAPAGAAMAQLKSRRYADKYRGLGAPIHLVAVEFSSASRNVAAFDVESA